MDEFKFDDSTWKEVIDGIKDDSTWKEVIDGITDDLTWEEVIDGVTVVYTDNGQSVHQGYREIISRDGGGYEDLGYKSEGIVKMYDSNGNKFYSNFESIEEANKEIAELAERGITAVVGPKAPCRDKYGNMVPNRSENAVGVFIVSVPEKRDDFSSPKIR